jgi:hypothetical protein
MFEGCSRSHALRGNGFWRLRLLYKRQSRISPGVQAEPGHQGYPSDELFRLSSCPLEDTFLPGSSDLQLLEEVGDL